MQDLAALARWADRLPLSALTARCIAFDFQHKTDARVELAEVGSLDGHFVWVDLTIDASRPEYVDAAAEWLVATELLEVTLVHDACHHESTNHLARFEHFLHLVLSACRMEGDRFELDRVDCFIGERCLLTIHKGTVDFVERVRRDAHDDFVRFAQSPSFLVYELWDHLTEHYVAVQKDFEDRVEVLQRDLIRNIDDDLFARVSQVGAHLLYFRKILLPARAVLAELSTRKTVFVSEATQPFLSNMIGTIDRVLGDALVDRDILTQSLNLHMSLVSHQTNRLMNKLTVVSVIFLPLSFLAGVYGMNFEVLPELRWAHGYAMFWAVVVVLVAGLVVFLRRLRLL